MDKTREKHYILMSQGFGLFGIERSCVYGWWLFCSLGFQSSDSRDEFTKFWFLFWGVKGYMGTSQEKGKI